MNTSAAPTYVSGTNSLVELGRLERHARVGDQLVAQLGAALGGACHGLAHERLARLRGPRRCGEREDEPLGHDQPARGGRG